MKPDFEKALDEALLREKKLKERYIEAVNDMVKLKRRLKNCICPHCGFLFEQALKK
jgi:RNase P subunit RPR2